MSLITTPGSPIADSYVQATDAASYLRNDRGWGCKFGELSLAEQETFVRWATNLLDRTFDYAGSVLSMTQALRWPRIGARDEDGRYIDQSIIPPPIWQATAVFALELAKRDRTEPPDVVSKGISSLSVPGAISLSVDPRAILPLVPDHVLAIIGVLGTPKGAALGPRGARTVSLIRS